MELDYFKDILFDLINECDNFDLADLRTDEKRNTIEVVFNSGTVLEVTVRATTTNR